MSLTRGEKSYALPNLRQQQGKREKARKLLAEIYDWFTEGFDTADLKEAKALLEELEGKATKMPRQKRKSSKKPSTRTMT